MTVLSGQTILRLGLVTPCKARETHASGLTFGLGPAGYDLTVDLGTYRQPEHLIYPGDFLLVAALEEFNIPPNVLAVVHDKSTWARRGLCVQNTVAEPGWRGYLTLELTNHGPTRIRLTQGMPIAQVVFHRLDEATEWPYQGKYQDQEPGPQKAR